MMGLCLYTSPEFTGRRLLASQGTCKSTLGNKGLLGFRAFRVYGLRLLGFRVKGF